ncbi:MAG: hypothetical protein JST59_21050 [Actinobacteria bacterium]|nr:hypothetical protein [Actinomycetota bacterium]
MSLKKLGITLGIVMALGAVMASSASAAAVTVNARWYVNGVGLNKGESRPVTCKATKTGTGETGLSFTSTVLKTKFVLSAASIECLPHATGETNAKIEQTEPEAGKFVAEDFGKIRFKGVKVVEPAGCVVPEETTTEPLKTEIYEEKNEKGESVAVFDKFEPTGEVFINLSITKCALENPKIPVKGGIFGLAEKENGENAVTGEEFTPQRLRFDEAVQTTAGGSLTLGTEPAFLMGTVDNELVSGLKFGVRSK